MISTKLQLGKLEQLYPGTPFLKLERGTSQNVGELAREIPLLNFAITCHQLGACLVRMQAYQAIARHIHLNACHYIYVVNGTGILEYDGANHILRPGTRRVGLLTMIVNALTY